MKVRCRLGSTNSTRTHQPKKEAQLKSDKGYGLAWYPLACKLHEGRDLGSLRLSLAPPVGALGMYCPVMFLFTFFEVVRQLCAEEPHWLADV